MHVGGKARRVKMTDTILDVCEKVRPKLLADGMFLVGLDVVGDKLMEVNVFSPGGIGVCQALYDANFENAVIDALEAKMALRGTCGGALENSRLATL